MSSSPLNNHKKTPPGFNPDGIGFFNLSIDRFCVVVFRRIAVQNDFRRNQQLFLAIHRLAAVTQTFQRRVSLPSGGEIVIDETEALTAIDVNTGSHKGKSEDATARALLRHPRDKYYIATKLSNFAPSTWSRDASLQIYHNSLRLFATDHLDYLLLHGIGMGADGMREYEKRFLDNGVLDFLLEEREKGHVRNLGFSYHGDIAVFDRLLAEHDTYRWDFVQIQLNYLDWKYAGQIKAYNSSASYLYNELDKRGIPVVVMEPLLGGRLSNVPNNIAALLKQSDPEASIASWAFRYAGSFPRVLTVLSGMSRFEHLEENIRTYSPLKPLTDREMALLQEVADRMIKYDTIPCNACDYCMPCPYGIDIPGCILHYNKCLNEDLVLKSIRDKNYREARRAYLVGYDRSVPRLRQASHCTGCGQCVPHCPQRIDIPGELRRIDAYVEKLKQDRL